MKYFSCVVSEKKPHGIQNAVFVFVFDEKPQQWVGSTRLVVTTPTGHRTVTIN